MRYEQKLLISPSEADQITAYLFEEPENESDCFGEDDVITKTVVFENGVEMDIKCCGVQFIEGESNLAWTEAVLFKDGGQLASTEPCGEYLGEWICEYDGDEYVVDVSAVKQIVVTDIEWDAPKSTNLPEKVVINIDRRNDNLLDDIDDYADGVSNYLSDTYGFCHMGFHVYCQ